MKSLLPIAFALTGVCSAAQLEVPEGIKIQVRLEQTVSSATAHVGDKLEFAVTQPVKIGESVVIADKAKAIGTVTESVKHNMVKAGKIDFSIDRVMAADGQWIPLRYSVNKSKAAGRRLVLGILSAGVAAVAGPPLPVLMVTRATANVGRQLIGSKDAVVQKGSDYAVYSDAGVAIGMPVAMEGPPAKAERSDRLPILPIPTPDQAEMRVKEAVPEAVATIAVTSSHRGDDIEVDGAFVGNTPSTIKLPAGSHQVRVTSGPQVWERTLRLTAGSTVSLEAAMTAPKPATAAQRTGTSGGTKTLVSVAPVVAANTSPKAK
jgi:hypothetical protein